MRAWIAKLQKQRNDRIFGAILIALGVVSGWGMALFFIFTREAVPLSMLAAPAGLVLLGLIILLGDALERSLGIDDELLAFPTLIRDDIEDLQKGKWTPVHGMVAITVFTLLGLIASVILYRKWQASWGGWLNVVVAAVLSGFLTGFLGISTNWFQDRKQRLSWGIFLIPLVAFGLSALLGIYFAEPKIESVRDLPVGQGTDYRYVNSETRIGEAGGQGLLSIVDGGMSLDFDDEGCLILVLVVIALACIAASAFIPHFWVVATTILWVIMLLITLRELLYVERFTEEGKPAEA